MLASLGCRLLARVRAVNVLPRRLARNKGHFVGSGSNHVPVLLVEAGEPLDQIALEKLSNVWQTAAGRELGTWDLAQRVDVEVV